MYVCSHSRAKGAGVTTQAGVKCLGQEGPPTEPSATLHAYMCHMSCVDYVCIEPGRDPSLFQCIRHLFATPGPHTTAKNCQRHLASAGSVVFQVCAKSCPGTLCAQRDSKVAVRFECNSEHYFGMLLCHAVYWACRAPSSDEVRR